MSLPCSLPPDDFFPALVGAFIEARSEVGTEDQGLIGAIKLGTRERLNQTLCNVSPEKREKELRKIIKQARILEQEIIKAILKEDTKNKNGFMSWSVGDGNNMDNIHFQRLLSLYQMRYGESEAQRVIYIFSNAENDGKYKLFIEYSETIDGSDIFIRRIWLKEVKNKEE